ncbi:hypothetical protein GQ44DRAFT_795083 [Phaeosphaeriaceae sp. PMI808]|nr:hypothetical protein GQ44DRAFT_795083 [Phaeosphaeriaceae sp. PMI808]
MLPDGITRKELATRTKFIFTHGSSEATNQAFRENPFLGVHRQGLDCSGGGGARAGLLTITSRPQLLWSGTSGIWAVVVRCQIALMRSEHSLFHRGCIDWNIALTFPVNDAEGEADYKHQTHVCIYPDPDSDDVHIYNATPDSTVTIFSGANGKTYNVHPRNHFRLTADRKWAIKVTEIHTFVLSLARLRDVHHAFLSEHLLRDKGKISPLPSM